jgi:uncharacterized protein (TIGR03435 family)
MLARLNWRRLVVMGYCAFFVALASVGAQTAAPNTPGQDELLHFDVATIKPVDPKVRQGMGPRIEGGRVMVGQVSVKRLVGYAFDVDDWQVDGGPAWACDTRYNIVGVPPEPYLSRAARHRYTLTPAERQMLQSLLIERFGLKYHREVKTGPVLLLTRGSGPLDLLHEPKDKDREPAGDMMQRTGAGGASTADGETFGLNITMAQFVHNLSPDLGKPVLDRTGLTAAYDFHVEPFDQPNEDITLMAIGAMQRLGLKLTAGKGPVETIVIDSVSMPTPN